MLIQKFRWSKVYESSEEELKQLLQARHIEAERVVGEAASENMQQLSAAESTLWCAEGSMVIRTASTSTSLQAGDAIRINANTTYDLHAGISGYVYYASR